MLKHISKIILILLVAGVRGLLTPELAVSQPVHPIDVQQSAASGDFLKAMVSFDKLPKKAQSTDAIVAAARSAWGLSLPMRAITEFDRALAQPDLEQGERAKVLLSRAIVEFQEGRHQLAALYAERATEAAKNNTTLSSRSFVLWGESLTAMKSLAQAAVRYQQGLELAAPEDENDLRLLIGGVQAELGKYDLAKKSYESIPIQHPKAPEAMRALAKLALQQGSPESVEFWLSKGREQFPDAFIDSWVDFALASAAIQQHDDKKLNEVLESATKRFPPSDQWYNLTLALNEEYEWNKREANGGAQ